MLFLGNERRGSCPIEEKGRCDSSRSGDSKKSIEWREISFRSVAECLAERGKGLMSWHDMGNTKMTRSLFFPISFLLQLTALEPCEASGYKRRYHQPTTPDTGRFGTGICMGSSSPVKWRWLHTLSFGASFPLEERA